MLFSLFSIFNCFCPDTSHLASVTRGTCHCYVITHCWPNVLGKAGRVCCCFSLPFSHGSGAKTTWDGGGSGATLCWFGELVREVRGRGEEAWGRLFGPSSFLKNWTDVAPLGRSRSNKRFPKLASTTTKLWRVQLVNRRTRWQEMWECLRAAAMI